MQMNANDKVDIIIEKAKEIEEQRKNQKSEIYYFDENGNSVDKENATRNIIRITDKEGNLVEEIFGIIDKKQENTKLKNK